MITINNDALETEQDARARLTTQAIEIMEETFRISTYISPEDKLLLRKMVAEADAAHISRINA